MGIFPELVEPPEVLKESVHVLGFERNHKQEVEETTKIRTTRKTVKKPISQLTIVSCVASVIDILGLVVPYAVKARLMVNDIWRTCGQKCDAPLLTGIAQDNISWREAPSGLIANQISRRYFESDSDEVE